MTKHKPNSFLELLTTHRKFFFSKNKNKKIKKPNKQNRWFTSFIMYIKQDFDGYTRYFPHRRVLSFISQAEIENLVFRVIKAIEILRELNPY